MAGAIGILGLGSIGLRHARNLIQRGRYVVGFDPDPVRRTMLAELGGQPLDTREAVIGESRAVVIASPNDRHLEDLRSVIAAGRHSLVEKPLAHRVGGVAELLAEAARKNLVVFCGFNLRFHPCVAAARARLDAGLIGRPLRAHIECASYLPDWRPGADYRKGYAADPVTGGVVFDIIHEIDLALHLFGVAHVAAASAGSTGALDISSDDVADFVLLHQSGVRSAIHLDYVTRPPVRRTRVVGASGSIEIDLLARRMTRLSPDGQITEDNRYPGSFAEDYVTEIDAFWDRIEGRPSGGAAGDEGLRALEIAIDIRSKAGLPQ